MISYDKTGIQPIRFILLLQNESYRVLHNPGGEVLLRPIGEAKGQLKETEYRLYPTFLAILRDLIPKHTRLYEFNTLKFKTNKRIGIS